MLNELLIFMLSCIQELEDTQVGILNQKLINILSVILTLMFVFQRLNSTYFILFSVDLVNLLIRWMDGPILIPIWELDPLTLTHLSGHINMFWSLIIFLKISFKGLFW